MKRLFVAILATLSITAWAQQRNFDATVIKTTKLTDTLYMLEGEGGNIGVCVGDDGIMVIDDQFAPLTAKILAAIRAISDKPLKFVLNTHVHGDHVGGNANMAKEGVVIVAHDNVRKRMSALQFNEYIKRNVPPYPRSSLPIITFADTVTFHFNGDDVTVIHTPPSHTDGDAIVYFAKGNVLHMGDVYASTRYPNIDTESGGSLKGFAPAVDMALAKIDDNTQVIAGHGGLSNKKELTEFRHVMDTIARRAEKLFKAGKTQQQMVAAKPTADFDARWNRNTPRTPDQYVETMYYDLARHKLK
jgi:cyclase